MLAHHTADSPLHPLGAPAVPAGNMVCKYEKLWAELPTDAANAAPQWQHREYRFVAAILSPSFLNGTGTPRRPSPGTLNCVEGRAAMTCPSVAC